MQRQGSPYGLVTLRAPHSAGLPPGETDAVGRGQLGAGGALTNLARETLMPAIPVGRGASGNGAGPGHADAPVAAVTRRERTRRVPGDQAVDESPGAKTPADARAGRGSGSREGGG